MMKTQIEDYAAIASRMRNRALSSEFHGNLYGADLDYLGRCRVRIGKATLIFTRNNHDAAPDALEADMSPRCWHLSMSGVGDLDRDAWLHALFGADLDRVWVEPSEHRGVNAGVSHWRLLCDASWSVTTAPPAAASTLRALGWKLAGEIVVVRSVRDAA
jgi:hypothetical protein